MTNITVLDSIMGSGKSTYVINMLNQAWMNDQAQSSINDHHQSQRFIVVVPLLTEVDRLTKACPNHHFKNPQPIHAQKLYHLANLIADGENIVTTHALFKMLNRSIYQQLLTQRYTLIIDEVLDCVDLFTDLTKKDKDLLFSSNMVFVNPTNNRLCWNYGDHPDYQGRFDQIKNLCDTGSLVSSKGEVPMWEFPSEFLRCFTEVIVCTYLFQGSPFYAYLKSEGFHLTMKAIHNNELIDWNDGVHEAPTKAKVRDLIKIYEGPMNNIGKETPKGHPLSSGWHKRADEKTLKRLQSSTIAFFERHALTPSALNAWTCFNKQKSKLSGKGYARGFIPNNAKATNQYAEKASMAYLCNWFYHPVIKGYFKAKGITVDEDLYALSAMLQWIWRSRIRNGEAIHLFIPSERMRGLLKAWLADDLPVNDRQFSMAA
jgi:hypothetical protein